MNAVISSVVIMLILSFARVNIVLSLLFGAFAGGLLSGLELNQVLYAFSTGLGAGANIALSYAVLGAFAWAISASKIPDFLMLKMVEKVKKSSAPTKIKYGLIFVLFLMAVLSQNVFPIHIAFIPILIPPLLPLFNLIKLDRRILAIALTTGLTATYLVVPAGFGDIYLRQVLTHNLNINGLDISSSLMPQAMAIPVLGMLLGFIVAIVVYRKTRNYSIIGVDDRVVANDSVAKNATFTPKKLQVVAVCSSIIISLAVQLLTGSMILCAASGFIILLLTNTIDRKNPMSYLLTA